VLALVVSRYQGYSGLEPVLKRYIATHANILHVSIGSGVAATAMRACQQYSSSRIWAKQRQQQRHPFAQMWKPHAAGRKAHTQPPPSAEWD
jgi:hypothetical protein